MSKLQAECELAVGSEAYGNDAVVRGSLGPSPSTDRQRSTRRVTELSEHKLSAACVAWRGVTAFHVFWTKQNKKGRARGNNVIIMSIRKSENSKSENRSKTAIKQRQSSNIDNAEACSRDTTEKHNVSNTAAKKK